MIYHHTEVWKSNQRVWYLHARSNTDWNIESIPNFKSEVTLLIIEKPVLSQQDFGSQTIRENCLLILIQSFPTLQHCTIFAQTFPKFFFLILY